MHRYTDPDCLIDFRELLELLPDADEDALASEFITGRVVAFVRNAGGGLAHRQGRGAGRALSVPAG